MLKFDHVTFKYDDENFNIIDDLSFHIDKGEFVSLIGVSGCGKSTVFRLINGLLKPCSGNIYVDGQSILGQKHYAGYMPQKDLLFPWRTIEKNLWLPMELNHTSKEERIQKSTDMLREIGLESYKDKYPKDLSGGMRQRVSFARTLLTDASLLLLDEPFSALDSFTRMSMQEWLLKQWNHFRRTILFITHDVEEAIFLSNKILVVTQQPIHTLEVIEIPAGYPKNREMLTHPDMVQLKAYLIEQLRKQVTNL